MPDPGFVEVTGSGSASAPPDALTASLAAEATAAGVAEALDAANQSLTAMMTALRAQGVDDADIRTSGIRLHPDFDHVSGRPSGFRAWTGIEVTVRELQTSGAVLSGAVAAGGDAGRIDGVQLAHTDPTPVLAAAREAAWLDAVARAEQYVLLAARELGRVITVVEAPGYGPPRPMVSGRAKAVAMSVEPGSQEVTALVTVRWELI
jgi:uncharacterized protein YggE